MLADGLRARGATVDESVAYETTVPQASGALARELLKDGRIDVVTFASSSTVRNLVGMLRGQTALLERVAIASIGPATSATARDLGLWVDIQAREYTLPGLVRAIRDHFAG